MPKYKEGGIHGGDKSKSKLSAKVQEEYRAKIDINLICKSLKSHLEGTLDLSATQLRAAEILLKKVLPDLTSVTVNTDPDSPFLIKDISSSPYEGQSQTWLADNSEVIEGESIQ